MSSLLAPVPGSGIAPLPPRERALGFWDTFVLWADLGVSFLVMVVGMFLVPGLSLGQAWLAILVGAVIGNLLLGIAGSIGSTVGVPTMVLLRAPLGIRGSWGPTVLNVLQLLGWAAFEVIVMAQAVDLLAVRVVGVGPAYRLWVLGFTALTVLMALGGPVRVVKQWLETFAVWAVALSTLWITGAVLAAHDLGALLSRPGTGGMSFWLAVDLVVAMPVSWFPLVADYTRFVRTPRAAFWGTAVGYFVPHAWFYALGALLALSAGVALDPQAPIVPLLAAIASLTAGWLALLVILVDETDEAFANIYSTAVSLQNLFPALSQRGLILGVGVGVLVVAWTVPLAQYESFLLLIGSAFVPLLGLLVADFFVVRGGRYEARELLRPGGAYWYRRGVCWSAVTVWAVGVAAYLLIAGLPALGVSGLVPGLGASLPSFVLTFLLHAVVGRARGPERRR
jgi:putative hydroxymethylpyrimidine transporter CytX